MGREVSYEDAVKLLGGDAAKIAKLVDTLTGVGLLALLGPFRDVLGWFDAKAELSKVTERLITSLVEKRSKLSRFERTERLQAAHSALALTAFFEAMAEAEWPFPYRSLELTAEEQRMLGSETSPGLAGEWRAPVPGPAESHDEFRGRLLEFYQRLVPRLQGFATQLAVWERLDSQEQTEAGAVLETMPAAAAARFDSLLGKLAAEFPEVAFWAGMREQTAVHARLRDVTTGLAGLSEVLDRIAAGSLPDARRNELAMRYAAALRQPIAASGEVPAGLRVPLLGEAFLPQLFRSVVVAGHARLSSEDWWEFEPVRDDLMAFLTGHLTSVPATTEPLLILGQPGSGKSVLAKILAGELPPTDFLPVLVVLRTVHAAADVQDQIEQAIRADTGERIGWPELSRSSGTALPVVILDGFDELLQATGVSQTDYLRRVVAFQRREAELGRPVAVIVTSRTSVADRATTPEGSVAIRLEPFDDVRVQAWLAVWNSANATQLDLGTVMRYPDLAGQPLLLLMLALYDAEGSALREAGDLRTDELYERLLARFARREVEKLADGLPTRERDQRVEAELRKLSVVAFAMFNRDAQWVTETQLEADLHALPGLTGAVASQASPSDLRAPLRPSELALGSFFFVHRARASRDSISLETYEFLHATFGEFLVARLIHGIVGSLIARERASTFPSGAAVDDDLLYTLLSFAPLSGRHQAVDFLRGIVTASSDEHRADWADLVARLFRSATMPRPPRAFDEYAPKRPSVVSRLAAYTSNLLLLALCAGDTTVVRLFDDREDDEDQDFGAWRSMCLFWRSQDAGSGWVGLLDQVAVSRTRRGIYADVGLSLDSAVGAGVPLVDMGWLCRVDSSGTDELVGFVDRLQMLRREAHFTCDLAADLQQHALEPLVRAGLEIAGDLVHDSPEIGYASVLSKFMQIVTADKLPLVEREKLYRACLRWCEDYPLIVDHLIRQMTYDSEIETPLVTEILGQLRAGTHQLASIRCGLAHLDVARHPEATQELAEYVDHDLGSEVVSWTELETEAAIRIAELELRVPVITEAEAELILSAHRAKRPDFVDRIRILVRVEV
ncbi:energy-coupling factor transporter ATP-binding protein EcfA2 [Actinoplanes tereljensis]|uniref:AAA+ ATPase domain-containing protein n=1 Tax=Paractinoplanes tereljensis TaxID=571912 RepID=A0A919TRI2_9ACTN|nr:hypothetical protein [Actinoplanes tereljensis]GIF20298.1 hypothetical protein Ate02nite_30280 [Actinoplanes tereljensis]